MTSPPPPARSTQEVTFLLLTTWMFLAVGQRLLLLGRFPVPTVQLFGEGALELRGRFLFFAFANGLATDLVVFTVLVGPAVLALHFGRRSSDRVYRVLSILPWIPVGVLANVLFFNWVSFLRTDQALNFMLLAMMISSPGKILSFLAREAGGWHKMIALFLGVGLVPASIGFVFRVGVRSFPAIGSRVRAGIRGRMVLILVLLQAGYVVRATGGSGIESLRGRWLFTVIREYEDPTWRMVTGAIWAFTSPIVVKDLQPRERQALRPVLTPWDSTPPIDPRYPLFRKLAFSGPRHPDPAAPADPVNVAFVVLESNSASDMGVFGDPDGLTPCFDKLAAEGFLYRAHVANATDSVGALFSLWTSSYADLAGNREGATGIRGSLPELLTREGYSTSFVVVEDTGWRQVAMVTRAMEVLSIPQGAAFWGDDRKLFAKSIEWIDRTPSPWLAAVFSGSHHSPWVIPGEDAGRGGDEWVAGRETLRYQDAELCTYVAELREREKKSGRRTLLVAVGDHGSRMGPENRFSNIGGLREDTLHVPLLFHAPGWIEPGTSEILSSHVDVLPTILDLLGIDGAETAAVGHSLLRGGQQRAFAVNGVGAGHLALLRSDHKLVFDAYKGQASVSEAFGDDPVDEVPGRDRMLGEMHAIHRLSSWLLASRSIGPRVVVDGPPTPTPAPQPSP